MKALPMLGIGTALALTLAGTAPAQSALLKFSGRIVHVSTQNIKVESPKGKTMSFLIVPHFDQVFHFDGKTTYQMKRLHDGVPVRVSYDERALGIRHADRIVVLDGPRVNG